MLRLRHVRGRLPGNEHRRRIQLQDHHPQSAVRDARRSAGLEGDLALHDVLPVLRALPAAGEFYRHHAGPEAHCRARRVRACRNACQRGRCRQKGPDAPARSGEGRRGREETGGKEAKHKEMTMHKKAMVIGGGVAGIQAALDLADMGVETFLVESEPSIGGRMAQLDKTFPTNDCAMCILSPKLVQAGGHPYIRILSNSVVTGMTGSPPNLSVTVLKKPRYVDESKCTGCGICVTKCPTKVPDPYNKGLSQTRAIRIPFPQAVPAVAVIDASKCLYLRKGTCRLCEKSCGTGAINFAQKE